MKEVKDTFYLFDLKKRVVWIQTVIAFLLLFIMKRVLGIIVFNYFACIVLKMIQVQEVQNLCIAMYQVGILIALSWVVFSDRGILVTEKEEKK